MRKEKYQYLKLFFIPLIDDTLCYIVNGNKVVRHILKKGMFLW
jgi:hypothetical protein